VVKEIVVSEIILCHKFVSPPGWISEEYKNSRQRHGIVYVLEGRAHYQMNGTHSFTTKAGEVLYLSPDTSYVTSCYDDSPFVHMTVNFQLTFPAALSALPLCLTPVNGQKICQIFMRLVNVWGKRSAHYRVLSMSLLYELIGALLRETDCEHDSYRKKLNPAVEYLEAHCCEPFPESALPQLCGMSETYFRRLFKRVYKESASSYRSRLRIGKACDMLLSGMYTVTEVAEVCGYEDPAYFSRAFKKIMGKSPSRYKTANN
jgi:AraC-like DNA-binding protein